MRDYDKEPLVVRNRYLLKKELAARLFMLLLFILLAYGAYFYAMPEAMAENDGARLRRLQSGLIIGVIGICSVAFILTRAVLKFKKNPLFIKIFNDKITYDYLTEKVEFKTFILPKENIKSVKWGFYPYAILNEKDKIWLIEASNDKFGAYLLSPLQLILSTIYLLIYSIINFKPEKYVLIRFPGGIMAIPKKEYPSNEKIPFEWRSLFNHHILQGAHYGK
ncbi:MAG: hypothetical protein LBQ18_08720 [Campylobacteraceae bacterium]|nr:hypothetical protein [Campylobacteraceae bacterium]